MKTEFLRPGLLAKFREWNDEKFNYDVYQYHTRKEFPTQDVLIFCARKLGVSSFSLFISLLANELFTYQFELLAQDQEHEVAKAIHSLSALLIAKDEKVDKGKD